MSQRKSGYKLMPNDFFATPEWVTLNLLAEEKFDLEIVEPACGQGHIINVLLAQGYDVVGIDIIQHSCVKFCTDFLKISINLNTIICNPPYGKRLKLAQQFVEHALAVTKYDSGKIAMLLPVTFDSGKTRRHLFADCPAWKKKIILTDRIEWANIEKTNESSTDHAWFIWDWSNENVPINTYQTIPKTTNKNKGNNYATPNIAIF
ncbi:MAG: hypothetical protein HRU28_17820 [Rhizobiales bacterium]|nr:hypothetical protein [Hyphomicrobiales bacterium]